MYDNVSFCLESDEEFPVALGNPEKTETCVEEKKVICHCIPEYCVVYRTQLVRYSVPLITLALF
jgi:hypothetical protein